MMKFYVVSFDLENMDDNFYRSHHEEVFIDRSCAIDRAEELAECFYVHDVEVYTGKVEYGKVLPDSLILSMPDEAEGGEEE